MYLDPSQDLDPIYVGKGHGDRAYTHLTHQDLSRPFYRHLHTMRLNGVEPRIIVIQHDMDEVSAWALEMDLIAEFGRKDMKTGTLFNRSAGGEGPSYDRRKLVMNNMIGDITTLKRPHDWCTKDKCNICNWDRIWNTKL